MFAETTLMVSRTRLTLNFFILCNIMERSLGIRITADADENLLIFAQQYPGIWCKEGPDLEKFCQKSHYHGVIHSTLTDNGLRKQIYNIFDVPLDKRGQKFVAFSKITEEKGGEEGFIRYICKGTDKINPFILHNSFNIDITQQYERYWSIYAGLKQEAKEKREKKQTNKANFKDYFVNNFVLNRATDFTLKPTHIAKIMFDYYLENEWEMPSPTQGQVIINDLYLRYSGQPETVLRRHYLQYWKVDMDPVTYRDVISSQVEDAYL